MIVECKIQLLTRWRSGVTQHGDIFSWFVDASCDKSLWLLLWHPYNTNNSVIFVGSVCNENIDDCLINSDGSVPCNGRGVCVDGVNSYDCLCQPGWVGADCQLLVNDCVGRYSYLPVSRVCIYWCMVWTSGLFHQHVTDFHVCYLMWSWKSNF